MSDALADAKDILAKSFAKFFPGEKLNTELDQDVIYAFDAHISLATCEMTIPTITGDKGFNGFIVNVYNSDGDEVYEEKFRNVESAIKAFMEQMFIHLYEHFFEWEIRTPALAKFMMGS